MNLSVARAVVLSVALHVAAVVTIAHFTQSAPPHGAQENVGMATVRLVSAEDYTETRMRAAREQSNDEPSADVAPPTLVVPVEPTEETPRPVALPPVVPEQARTDSPADNEPPPAEMPAPELNATEVTVEPLVSTTQTIVSSEASADRVPPWMRPAPVTERVSESLYAHIGEILAEHDFAQLPTVADVWEIESHRFVASVTHVPADDAMGHDRVAIEVSTEIGGERLTTHMRMRQLAFSNFAQFVDRWDPQVQIHDDIVDGRFHSNSEIYVDSSSGVQPTFHGPVTTASRRINTSQSSRRVNHDEVFLGGLETGVRRIPLPRDFLPVFETVAGNGSNVQRFDADARIRFNSDGTFTSQSLAADGGQRREQIEGVTYLVAEPKAEIFVSGTVVGAVLVYSPAGITIEGELRYGSDPELAPDSDDFLGLVTDRTVAVAEQEITGPGDLRVDAAIYARGRFAIRGYKTRQQGQLTIFGSLTAGSITATEPRFATQVRYDARLEERRPPGFPTTNRYLLDAWDRAWHADPLASPAAR